MTHSVSEFRALFERAARGANVPIHQARELASVISLSADEDLLNETLAALHAPRLAPVFLKSAEGFDFGQSDPIQSIPAALDFAQAGISVRHDPSRLSQLWAKARGFDHNADGFFTETQSRPARATRISVDQTMLDRINDLAKRTYVPATQESRDGAGAGSIDND